MLQLGSIFGQVFSLEGAAGIDPRLADSTGIARRLVANQFLRRSGADYLIADDLVREVAYRLLPRLERQVLHAAAASWLETSRPDGLAHEVVASHYREAATIAAEFEPDSAETVELRRLAVARLVEAATTLAGTALPEALAHLRSAAELVNEEERPPLLQRMKDLAAGRTANL
jgi:predicted ATPase